MCLCLYVRVYVKPVAFCDEKQFDFLKVFRNPPSYKRQQIFSEIQEPFKAIYLISPVIIFHKHDIITNINSMSSPLLRMWSNRRE